MKSRGAPPNGTDETRRRDTASESIHTPRFRFLSTLTHELRTPLAAILGYADVLLEELPTEGRPRNAAEGVRRQGEHLLALIDDLLDLVRLDRGEIEITPADADLRAVVARTVLAFVDAASQKEIELTFETQTDEPTHARFDSARVGQVVRHLVDNAIKFTASGAVRVRLALDGRGAAVVSVNDTGPGLSPERFEELAEPLVQGDDTLSRGFGGLGVGLALCHSLARRMGGTLTCHGVAGRGTSIRFRFPLEPVSRPVGVRSQGLGPLRGRVLLVEDSLDNQRLIGRILERVGLEVTVAPDGRAGVDAAMQGDFALILMDIQMPRMDGLDATRELRSRGCRVPIVAMTANTEPEARRSCIDAGCNDFLTKPVDRMVLLERLARLMNRKRPEGV
ncbi:MAG: response regulator [Myxococcota bacterium]